MKHIKNNIIIRAVVSVEKSNRKKTYEEVK
jgi:hypothetical protein